MADTKAPHDQEVLSESVGWFKDFFSTHFATAARPAVSQEVQLSDGMCFFEERSSMPMWLTWTLHISVTTDLSSNPKIISDVSQTSGRDISSFFYVSLLSRSFTKTIPQWLPLGCKLCDSGI